jgi:hypothetical protein
MDLASNHFYLGDRPEIGSTMSKHQKKYPWPASQIDRDVMVELHRASVQSGRPITVLVRDAVHQAMTARLEQAPQAPIGFTQDHQPRPAA